METLRFLDLPFSIRKLHFMRLESISYKSVLIFLIFNIPISLRAQIFNWGGGFGSYSSESANAIEVDGAGNTYVVGKYRNTVDFDPGGGAFLMTAQGESDIFILKLDPNGQFLWSKSIGGTSFDYANDIKIDGNGDVFITGVFRNTVDFDPGTSTHNLTSNGQYDVFVLKMDQNGNHIWSTSFGGGGYDYGNKIDVDSFGNIWVIGSFRNTVDFNAGATSNNKTSNGGEDIYVLKLNFLGNFISVQTMGGTGNDSPTSLAIDPFGFLFVTGTFEETADFNPSNTTTNLISNGLTDLFLIKLNFSGGLLFAKSIGGIGNDGSRDIKIDQFSNLFLTGYFSETTDFDPSINGTSNLVSLGYEDAFTLKLNNLGDFIWARSFGNNNFIRGNSINIDSDGNVFTGGFFRGICDIDPGSNVIPINSNGYMDIILQKLDQNGNYLNAISLGNSGDDQIIDMKIVNNEFYICGTFMDHVDFNPSILDHVMTSNGDEDAFVLKFGMANCSNNATSPLYLELNVDDQCQEINWELNASSGLTLYQGGPYDCDGNGGGTQANSTIRDTFYLFPYECYDFVINDAGGNGMSFGSWQISDYNGDQIVHGGGNFGSQSLQSFFIENDISNMKENKNNRSKLPYPNPAHINETIHIPVMKSDFELYIVDVYGKIIQTHQAKYPENTIKNLTKGIYFFTISNHQNLSRNFKIIVQ